MDSKTVRLAVLLAITAIALILVTVYAVNDGGKKRHGSAGEAATTDQAVTADAGGTGMGEQAEDPMRKVTGSDFVAYGEQIGDQPKAFLYDESFFDPMRDVVTGISEGNEITLTMSAQATDNMIHVSIVNERGGLEAGTAFQVIAEQASNGKEKTYTDTDRDGQIEFRVQANGTYRLRLLEAKGYEVPAAAVVVKVDAPIADASAAGSTGNSGAGGTGSTEDQTSGTGDTAGTGASGTANTADPTVSGNGSSGADRQNSISGNGSSAATEGQTTNENPG